MEREGKRGSAQWEMCAQCEDGNEIRIDRWPISCRVHRSEDTKQSDHIYVNTLLLANCRFNLPLMLLHVYGAQNVSSAVFCFSIPAATV